MPPELFPGPAPIPLRRAVCGDLAAAERREWWIANGRGGYAGGTIALSLTRRYHALLAAPVEPRSTASLYLPAPNLGLLHALLIRNASGLP